MNDIEIDISILFVIGCKLKSDYLLSQAFEASLDIQSNTFNKLIGLASENRDFFITQLFNLLDGPEPKKTGIILAFLENKMLPYIYHEGNYHLLSFTYSAEYRVSAIYMIRLENNLPHLMEGYIDLNIFEKLPQDDEALLAFANDILNKKYNG